MSYGVWPATGAMQRRLDDGKAAGGKPGNMYQYLGGSDEERAKNLKMVKDWLGDGAWNLNRFKARGDVAGRRRQARSCRPGSQRKREKEDASWCVIPQAAFEKFVMGEPNR